MVCCIAIDDSNGALHPISLVTLVSNMFLSISCECPGVTLHRIDLSQCPSVNKNDHSQGKCRSTRPRSYVQLWIWGGTSSQCYPGREQGRPFLQGQQSMVPRRRELGMGRADQNRPQRTPRRERTRMNLGIWESWHNHRKIHLCVDHRR